MSSRRRISVDFSTGQTVTMMHDAMDKLHALWDRVHMEDHQRSSRITIFYLQFKELMDEMVSSESEMVAKVHDSINSWLPLVNEMRTELNCPPFDTSAYLPGSIALFKSLDLERARLKSLKQDRLGGQQVLLDELRTLCVRLGREMPKDVTEDEAKVWSDEEMREWQEMVTTFSHTLNEHMEVVMQWQTDIKRYYTQMGSEPSDDFVRAFADTDMDDPDLIFDTSFITESGEAHATAQGEYQEWLEQAEFDYNEAMIALVALWDECHIPVTERRFEIHFNAATHTGLDVANVKSEVEKLKRYREERAAVYEKLSEWKGLWKEKIDYESKCNEKSAYNDRGGQLQAILKRQKFIATRLPILLGELKCEEEKYKAAHPLDDLVVDGVSPSEHVNFVIKEHEEQKELERLRKKHQVQQSGMLPRTPSAKGTPLKRFAPKEFGANCTSAKLPKTQSHTLGRVTCSPAFCLRPSNFPSTPSLQSVITPVRAPPEAGPMTSSPKELEATLVLPPPRMPISASRRGISRLPPPRTHRGK